MLRRVIFEKYLRKFVVFAKGLCRLTAGTLSVERRSEKPSIFDCQLLKSLLNLFLHSNSPLNVTLAILSALPCKLVHVFRSRTKAMLVFFALSLRHHEDKFHRREGKIFSLDNLTNQRRAFPSRIIILACAYTTILNNLSPRVILSKNFLSQCLKNILTEITTQTNIRERKIIV